VSENTLDHERNIKIGPFDSRTIVFLEFGFCPLDNFSDTGNGALSGGLEHESCD
jgi:hypothetical protein